MLGNFEPDRRQFKDLTTFAMLVGERFANLVHGRLALRASVRLAEPMLDDVVGIGDALEGVSAPPLLSARFAPGLRPVCARFAPGLRPVLRRRLMGLGGLAKLPESEDGGLLLVRELRFSSASSASTFSSLPCKKASRSNSAKASLPMASGSALASSMSCASLG